MYFALVNANSFFDSAKKIKCILYLALCSVKFGKCAHPYHFFNKFGQVDGKLFPNKKKKKGENTHLVAKCWGHDQFSFYIFIVVNLVPIIFNLSLI